MDNLNKKNYRWKLAAAPQVEKQNKIVCFEQLDLERGFRTKVWEQTAVKQGETKHSVESALCVSKWNEARGWFKAGSTLLFHEGCPEGFLVPKPPSTLWEWSGTCCREINGRNPFTNLDTSESMRLEASKGAEGATQGPCEAALYRARNTKGTGEPMVEEAQGSPYCSPATSSKDREEMEADNSQRCTRVRQQAIGK